MSQAPSESATTTIDWSTISTNIECPLCQYNLRGLIEPRCPECGYHFDWADLLDPDRRRHRYLFEHHPRRNWWSFFRTLTAGLRPHKFWHELNPRQNISVKRLWIYWILCSCFLLLIPLAEVMKVGVLVARMNAIARTYGGSIYVVSPSQGIQQSVTPAPRMLPSADFFREVWEAADGVNIAYGAGLLVLTILLWPWLTFASLMIFQASMRKARIQRSHVLRCVIYSADAWVWYVLLSMAAFISLLVVLFCGSDVLSSWAPDEVTGYLQLLLCIVLTYRLRMAYWTYLQFDHPFWTVLASQVIVLLAAGSLLFWGGRLLRIIEL